MNDIVPFSPPRLPFHPAIQERFGIDKAGWNALVGSIWPNAKSVDAVAMALSYCRARNLDPFKKPVHIVPMWSAALGQMVETVWPGISEIRTTAFRTGNYAGCDEAEFGPMMQETFTGQVKTKTGWEDRSVTVTFPEWCRMTVYRELNGRICKFVGPKVQWMEEYATIGKSDLPNEMWETRAQGQLEKCAEAAALRKAFPEEIGNQTTAEEMEGKTLIEVTNGSHPISPLDDGPPAPPPVSQPTQATEVDIVEAGRHEPKEVVWEDQSDEPPAPSIDPEISEKIKATWLKDIPKNNTIADCDHLESAIQKMPGVTDADKRDIVIALTAQRNKILKRSPPLPVTAA